MTTTAHSTSTEPEPVHPPTDDWTPAVAAASTIGVDAPDDDPDLRTGELAGRLLRSARWQQ
jgi:hypothetical protein